VIKPFKAGARNIKNMSLLFSKKRFGLDMRCIQFDKYLVYCVYTTRRLNICHRSQRIKRANQTEYEIQYLPTHD